MGGMECMCGTALPAQVVGREGAGQDTSGLTCVAADAVACSADVAKDNVGVTWQVRTPPDLLQEVLSCT